jgi:uncharacterized protein YbjT (DUF2867 family)
MILVTGAAGKTGQSIIRALLKREKQIRALVHRETQIKPLKKLGAEEVIAGDMSSQKTMDQAVQGVKSVYHICPNVSPDEIKIGKIVIKSSQSSGVEHFVYHSVLHPQIEAMPHHWQKMRVEELLFESGLPYTILQPAPYMQNILAYWDDIVNKGTYPVPYAKNTRLNAVDLDDIAEVAALVLCESGYEGAIYELCGIENLSQIELTHILSQYLVHRVDVEVIPIEEWEANSRNNGMGDYQLKTLIKMFKYYEEFGLTGNPHVLESLLRRSPTSYITFIEHLDNSYAN